MSVRSYPRSTKIEDYHSDEESPPHYMQSVQMQQQQRFSSPQSYSRQPSAKRGRPQLDGRQPVLRNDSERRMFDRLPQRSYRMSCPDFDETAAAVAVAAALEEEEELRRALYELDLHQPSSNSRRRPSLSHRPSCEYGEEAGIPRNLVAPQFNHPYPQVEDEDYYDYLAQHSPHAYSTPPHYMYMPPPPSATQWLPPPPLPHLPMMMDNRSPRFQPRQRELQQGAVPPYVRRSSSNRSYNKRNRLPFNHPESQFRRGISTTHEPENITADEYYSDEEHLSGDRDDREGSQAHDMRGSYSTMSPRYRRPRRRANSFTEGNRQPHPSYFFEANAPPSFLHPPFYPAAVPQRAVRMRPGFPPFSQRRRVHSVPTTPHGSDSEEEASNGSGSYASSTADDEVEEDYSDLHSQSGGFQRTPSHIKRRISTSAMPRKTRMARSLSFSENYSTGHPPPPPPPSGPASGHAPPSIMLQPPPPPPTMMERPTSMYNIPANDFFDALPDNGPSLSAYQQQQHQAATSISSAPVTPTTVLNNNPLDSSIHSMPPMEFHESMNHRPEMNTHTSTTNTEAPTNQNPRMMPPPPPPPQAMSSMLPPPPPSWMNRNSETFLPHQQQMIPPMSMLPMPPLGQNSQFWPPPPELFFNPPYGNDFPPFPPLMNDPNLMAQMMMHGAAGVGGGIAESNAHPELHASSSSAAASTSPQQPQEGPGGGAGGHHRQVSEGSGIEDPRTQQHQQQQNQMRMMMRPPSEPMFRKGLSMLGGLFGGSGGGHGFLPPPDRSGLERQQQKKDAKLAMEYAKLQTFYCWRKLMDGQQQESYFESFSIPNQKVIKKKLNKNPPQTLIMLMHREKKLPGEIMVDINQNRGCCLQKMGGKTMLIQLEIKEESYTPNNEFVFANNRHQPPSNGGWQ